MDINIIDLVLTTGMGLLTFFAKRSLASFDNITSENSKAIEELEKNQVKYEIASNKNLQDAFDRQTKELGRLIQENNKLLLSQISETRVNVKELEKELSEHKQDVAGNYIKQDDFNEVTRGINKKLDIVYGEVKELNGHFK